MASRIAHLPAGALLVLLALAIVALNPVGYVGGGGDDWHYLNAAECWAANGVCLPHDHWSARWPLVAPLAGAIAMFGESRTSLWVVPLGYALLALLLFSHIVTRLFGRPAALLSGSALLLTPVFATLITKPNIDMVELCFILAAAAAWLEALASRRRVLAFAAGAALGLAFQSRETSAAVVAVAGAAWLLLPSDRKALALWAVPGFLTPLAAEMVVYWVAAGDPLGRIHLAFGHTRIVSTELSPSVDTSRSPLFNPDFIAGWKPANGVRLHWLADPVLNLLTHPEIGLSLSAAILLLLGVRRSPSADAEAVRRALVGLGVTTTVAALLIYGLAIDPKPRMFLPLACAAAVAIGVLLPVALRSRARLLAAAGCAIIVARSLVVIAASPNVSGAEAVAASWIAERPGALSIDETARRHLALVPAARGLPVDHGARPFHLAVVWGGCRAGAGGGPVAASYSFREGEPAPARLARSAGFGLGEDDAYFLCLLRRG